MTSFNQLTDQNMQSAVDLWVSDQTTAEGIYGEFNNWDTSLVSTTVLINLTGIDTDSDGINNDSDTDDDGDGTADVADAFPLDATETLDTDSDGIGNNTDTDDDGDGYLDDDDEFPNDNSKHNPSISITSPSDSTEYPWGQPSVDVLTSVDAAAGFTGKIAYRTDAAFPTTVGAASGGTMVNVGDTINITTTKNTSYTV